MANYTNNQKHYACYLDLRRAAVSFYKNPQGTAHSEFLLHALKVLREFRGKKLNKYKKAIIQLVEITSKNDFSERERINLADKILTTGILLR